MITTLLPFDAAALAQAAALIRDGEPVAVATETVYGLAADARRGTAVAAIYAAKGRPSFNPLIVHVPDLAAARAIGRFDPPAERLARRFWPGPLTLVVPLAVPAMGGAAISSLVTAGLDSVALRVPAHPAMRALLAAVGVPLAAPSANASGRLSPTRAEHVMTSLGGRIPLVLDSGATGAGLESTIVMVTATGLRLLRPGPIAPEALAEAAGLPVLASGPEDAARPLAPGGLASHYAPQKPLRLHATERRDGEWLIGFGPVAGDATLSAGGDLVEAAARLFDLLHQADANASPAIAIAPIPADGLGVAINDRLGRAAFR